MGFCLHFRCPSTDFLVSSKQLETVSRIAKSASPNAVGKPLGLSERTIQRWTKLPEFIEAVDEIRERSNIIAAPGELALTCFNLSARGFAW